MPLDPAAVESLFNALGSASGQVQGMNSLNTLGMNLAKQQQLEQYRQLADMLRLATLNNTASYDQGRVNYENNSLAQRQLYEDAMLALRGATSKGSGGVSSSQQLSDARYALTTLNSQLGQAQTAYRDWQKYLTTEQEDFAKYNDGNDPQKVMRTQLGAAIATAQQQLQSIGKAIPTIQQRLSQASDYYFQLGGNPALVSIMATSIPEPPAMTSPTVIPAQQGSGIGGALQNLLTATLGGIALKQWLNNRSKGPGAPSAPKGGAGPTNMPPEAPGGGTAPLGEGAATEAGATPDLASLLEQMRGGAPTSTSPIAGMLPSGTAASVEPQVPDLVSLIDSMRGAAPAADVIPGQPGSPILSLPPYSGWAPPPPATLWPETAAAEPGSVMTGQAPQSVLSLPAWASESNSVIRGGSGNPILALPAGTSAAPAEAEGGSILASLPNPGGAAASEAESAVPSLESLLGKIGSGAGDFMSGLTDMAGSGLSQADQLAQGALGWLGPAAAALPMFNDIIHGRSLFPGWQQRWQNTMALFGGGSGGSGTATASAGSGGARPLPPPPPALMATPKS